MTRVLTIALLLLTLATGCLAEMTGRSAEFMQRRHLDYYIDLPEDYTPDREWPLVVCLHGYGATPLEFESAASRIVPGGAIGLCPQGLFPMDEPDTWREGFAWYTITSDDRQRREMLEASTRWILQTLQEVKDSYPVAKDKVFLYGFSQGGIMSYHLGLSFPELFLGVIPAGALLEESKAPLYPLDNRARRLPFMAMHGAFDPVIAYEAGKSAVDTLSARGVPAAIRRYPAGHAITAPMLDDAHDFAFRMLHQGESPRLRGVLSAARTPDDLDPVLLSPSTPTETGQALLAALRDETDPAMREKLVYLLGACRCLNAQEYLAELLHDASETPAMRQNAYNALAKLGTEQAWAEWETADFKLVVQRVVDESQAAELGLLVGDVMLRYNDIELHRRDDVEYAKRQTDLDSRFVSVDIERDGEIMTLLFTPGPIGVYLDEVIR